MTDPEEKRTFMRKVADTAVISVMIGFASLLAVKILSEVVFAIQMIGALINPGGIPLMLFISGVAATVITCGMIALIISLFKEIPPRVNG